MLQFLRKYQSYIYLVVTIVIVISFSFFGTQNTIVLDPVRDQVVFTAVNGENIRRHELDEMVTFISTDSYDKQASQGAWGPNFLNNGVIRNDLLKTGLAASLASAYWQEIEKDLTSRSQKEKAYKPYQHPQAKFIGQESVWAAYAPKINTHLKALQNGGLTDPEKAFNARAELFLSEFEFPHYYSRYVIESQEKQFNFISHDPVLDQTDLSIFGYRTEEDWFGPRFMRLAAQFIMNAAKMAEEKGYEVTKEEALADLMRNSQLSYKENVKNPNIGVANSTEYFNQQLRFLGMTEGQAVKTWRQVLLFRRLFHDVGSAVFESPLAFEKFADYTGESVTGDLYELRKELQFPDYRTMQKFEIYLSQVAKRSPNTLELPENFLDVATLSKRAPEFLQKRYLIKLKEANKSLLLSKVSLKETWNFELSHWDLLKENFPELGVALGVTQEERLKALDALSPTTRARVDLFAKKQVVEAHPEWLIEALEKSRERKVTVGLNKQGPNANFEGMEEGESLKIELDAAEIGGKPLQFTANNQNYYLITLLDRSEGEEILTFKEAEEAGILDSLLENKLRLHFQKNKDAKNWTSFDESKEAVTDDYFEPLLKEIAISAKEEEKKAPNLLAPLRFFSLMQNQLEKLKINPELYTSDQLSETKEDRLSPRRPLSEQWKLEKKELRFVKSQDKEREGLFNLAVGSWTSVLKAPNGDLSFFFVKKKGAEDASALFETVSASRKLLSHEAEKHFMKKVLQEIKDLHAISLEYLNQRVETLDVEQPSQEPEFELG